MINSLAWLCASGAENMFVKIVRPGGHIELHDAPLVALDVMLRNPNCYVARAKNIMFHFPRPGPILPPDALLPLGQMFYVVPINDHDDGTVESSSCLFFTMDKNGGASPMALACKEDYYDCAHAGSYKSMKETQGQTKGRRKRTYYKSSRRWKRGAGPGLGLGRGYASACSPPLDVWQPSLGSIREDEDIMKY